MKVSKTKKKDILLDPVGLRNRACQTRYRENDTQTLPWHPPYKAKENQIPEQVEIDPVLNLENGQFDQFDVDAVKRFRQKKEWEKFISKIFSPETANIQKDIVLQLEKEKWSFMEKRIDEVNKRRLELAHKELEEQHKIINERMEFRMNNARIKCEELKRAHAEKYRLRLEREIRRNNVLNKLGRYPHKRDGTQGKVYNVPVSHLYQPKRKCEVLCPEAIPSTLHDAYMMLERNLDVCKSFKKDYPPKHDCHVPKFHEITHKDEHADDDHVEICSDDDEKKRREKIFSNSKSLIATLIKGRAVQSVVHREALVNETALTKKYNGGRKLYESGFKDSENFEILIAEGIRDHNLVLKMKEKIQGVIHHLEGRTISTVLDFTSKEFIRLKEHRRLLELADVAERERWAREAKEAGRRQEEEQRLRQHEEMYKEVMKTHEISSDALLDAVLEDEIDKTGSGLATLWTRVVADYYKEIFGEPEKEDPYRKLEYAARLADRCLSVQSQNMNIKLQGEKRDRKFANTSKILVEKEIELVKSPSLENLGTDETEPWDGSDKPTGKEEPEIVESLSSHESSQSSCMPTCDLSFIDESSVHEETSQVSSIVPHGSDPHKINRSHSDEEKVSDQSNVGISEREDLNMKKNSEKLLDQVIRKAEHYVKKYQETAENVGSLHKTCADSLSDSYQILAKELLRASSKKKSRSSVRKVIQPWMKSIVNEASNRLSSIILKANEQDFETLPPDTYDVKDFYYCASDTEEVHYEEKFDEEVDVEIDEIKEKLQKFELLDFAKPIEFSGILDEKLQVPLVPEEEILGVLVNKNK